MAKRRTDPRRRLGALLMAAGGALVAAALALYLLNQWEARRAERTAEQVLPQMLEQLEAPAETPAPYPPYAPEMTVAEIDGYGYIGYVSIPELGLELPVMSEWDYTRLKLAPCRYAGSTRTDDLVIAAHNYARHFGLLTRLSPGDEVCFVDMDGLASLYAVVEVDILAPTAIEEMTSGEYDLTLFTCTYGGKSRVTVRCDRTEPQ